MQNFYENPFRYVGSVKTHNNLLKTKFPIFLHYSTCTKSGKNLQTYQFVEFKHQLFCKYSSLIKITHNVGTFKDISLGTVIKKQI